MAQYFDKDALVAEIESLKSAAETILTGKTDLSYWKAQKYLCERFLSFIDTLEIKEVIAEQECTCNEALNRIIGGSWNLLCPVNKLGLKTGDKVKVIIEAQKGE